MELDGAVILDVHVMAMAQAPSTTCSFVELASILAPDARSRTRTQLTPSGASFFPSVACCFLVFCGCSSASLHHAVFFSFMSLFCVLWC